jgi:transcriptional regulator with XRE-family HTH domain
VNIGKKIREFRKRSDWTLAELAKHSGVALSSLSRIETEKMTGTLESHVKIARALGVRLQELYEELDLQGPPFEVRSSSSHPEKIIQGKGVTFAILTKGGFRKKMLPTLLSLQPGKSTREEAVPAGTERFLYLLKGRLEATIGRQKVRLNGGDSLYLHASAPHELRNSTTTTALALSITSPPTV